MNDDKNYLLQSCLAGRAACIGRGGNLVAAVSLLRPVLKEGCSNENALVMMAKLLSQYGKYDEAIEFWNRARLINPAENSYKKALKICEKSKRLKLPINGIYVASYSLLSIALLIILAPLVYFSTTHEINDSDSFVTKDTPVALNGDMNALNEKDSLVFHDNFDGQTFNIENWHTQKVGIGPSIKESQETCYVEIPSNSRSDLNALSFSAGLVGVFSLKGDFDAQVNYQILSAPSSSGVRIGLAADSYIIERVSFGNNSIDFPNESRDKYLVDNAGVVIDFANTTDQVGKLRLVRKDEIITGYYFLNDAWVPINKSLKKPDDVNISMNVWSQDDIFSDQTVRVAFDDFILNEGTMSNELPEGEGL